MGELVVLLNTASFVLTELSSTRTILSVTGGSTLTAPPLRTSILSMMRLLLKGKPLLEPLIKLSMELLPSTVQPLLQLATTLLLMLLWEAMRRPEEDETQEDLAETATEEEGDADLSGDKRRAYTVKGNIKLH